MKRKLRIFSNIAIICLSVCMFAFGVYAASTVSVTTEGTVTFNASGVYADVTRTITGVKNPPSSSTVTIDADTTEGASIPMNADLEFETADSLVEIKFEIRNKASATETERNIYVTVTEGNTLEKVNDNVIKTVEHLGAEFIISPNTTRSFSIYLSVKDVNKSATANYDYIVSLKNATQGTVLTDSTATFTLSNNEYTVSNVTSTASHITVPETYNGKPVTKVGDTAFFGVMETVQKVTFANSVTSISDTAFQGCSNVIAAVLPNGISDPYALSSLSYTGIKTFVISSSITEVPSRCFCGTKVDAIIIPSSVSTFGGDSFLDSSTSNNYRHIIYKGTLNNWLSISFASGQYGQTEECNPSKNAGDAHFFIAGERVVNIEINSDVGNSVLPFYNQIQNIVLGTNCESIGEYAFSGCYNATITIPTSVTTLMPSSLDAVYKINYLGTYEQWQQIEGLEHVWPNSAPILVCNGVVIE